MQFIDLAAQYQHLKDKIDARIHTVLDHGKYIMGPEVQELEEKLSEYVGVKHTVSCANGTDALTLALMVLDVKHGDAVFCPTFTFFATAETIAFEGVTPVFVDSNKDTFNICPMDLEERIKAVIAEGKLKPKAIIAVDLFGLPADYNALRIIADKYKLKIIEDAAQGFGGQINGKRAGSFGDIATTSFFPAKPLGCYGDGGALFTDNDYFAELLRSYRVHGKGVDKYDNIRIGMNSRLDTIQAAVLIEKVAAFPQELINRNKAAKRYTRELKNKYKTPVIPENYVSSWAQYTIKANNRELEMDSFNKKEFPTMIYYEKCLHLQSAFEYLGYKKGDFPTSEYLSNCVYSLPMHPYMENHIFNEIKDDN